jgi:hypothetical protein
MNHLLIAMSLLVGAALLTATIASVIERARTITQIASPSATALGGE